uniref:Uncharacterized protein n=1 Tax=viral metagenome TaxID=1070528 RepID=A0A6M3J010_9ZZZZ
MSFEQWQKENMGDSGFAAWQNSNEQNISKEGMIERFGKQLYNVAIAQPVYATGTKSTVGEIGTLLETTGNLKEDFKQRIEAGLPVTRKRVEWYAKPGRGKQTDWEKKVWSDYQAGKLNVVEQPKKNGLSSLIVGDVTQSEETFNKALAEAKITNAEKADISMAVSQASGFKDEAVDLLAGITGFMAQLAVLRRNFPGISEIGIWELQNEVNGGKIGRGALSYAAWTQAGKLVPKAPAAAGKIKKAAFGTAKLGAEVGAITSLSAVEQLIDTGEIDWRELAKQAGIIVGLHSLAVVKAKIRNRDPKMMAVLEKYYGQPVKGAGEVAVAQPQLLERLVGQRTAAAVPHQVRTGAKKRWAKYAKEMKSVPKKVEVQKTKIQSEINKRLKTAELESISASPDTGKMKRLASEIEALDFELMTGERLLGKKVKNIRKIGRKFTDKKGNALEVPKGLNSEEAVRYLSENIKIPKKPKTKGLAPTFVEAQPKTIPTVKGLEPELGVGRVSTKAIIHELFDSTDAKLAVSRLTEFTKEFKAVGLKERKAAVSELRGRQATGGKRTLGTEWKKAVKAGGGYFAAGMKVFKGFVGKAEVPEYEPPNLTDPQWDILARRAKHIYTGPQIEALGGKIAKRGIFRFANTMEAIGKLKKGFVPTLYEWALLEPVLGTKLTGELHNALSTKQAPNLWRALQTTRDAFKVLKLGYDIQPFRQTSTISTRHPVITWKARGKSLMALGSALSKRRKYIEKFREARNRDPRIQMFIDEYGSNYLSGQKWASVEAGTKLQEYGQFPEWLAASKSRPLRLLGHFIKSMEEATEVGVNSAMDMLNVNAERHLSALRASGSKYAPKTDVEVAEWRRLRGRAHNAFLKRIVARTPEGKRVQAAANLLLISPAHFVSRPVGVYEAVVSPFRKFGNIRTRTYATQVIGLNLVKMAAMGSLLAHVKAKYLANDPSKEPLIDGSPDPSNNLFGKARVSGSVIDLTGGDATDYRDFARLMLTAYAYAKQKVTGKVVTEVGEYKVRPAWDIIKQHMISREALHLGIAQALLSGKDWLGRPVPRWQSFLQIFTPSQLDSMIERFQADGTLDALQTGDVSQVAKDTIRAATVGIIEATGTNVMSYPVPAYQREQAFLDDMSKERFGMEWDYLTPLQQIQIRTDNRDTLQTLANQKASESVENPYTGKSAEERQRETGEFLRRKLNKPVKKILKSIDIQIPRTFNKFRLNDERLNRYIDLVTEELNERIPAVRLEGLTESTQRNVLKAYVEMSKKMAYSRLMQELRK